MNNTRYALETTTKHGRTIYYISRIKWTPDIAAATLFRNPDHADIEIELLPDTRETDPNDVHIRAITLTPDRLIK